MIAGTRPLGFIDKNFDSMLRFDQIDDMFFVGQSFSASNNNTRCEQFEMDDSTVKFLHNFTLDNLP